MNNKEIVFAGVNLTKHVTSMMDEHQRTTVEQDIRGMIEHLKELAKNEKVSEAHQSSMKLYGEEEDRQENDDYTYREVNFNIMRNYRNILVEELVEITQGFNEFIDFPEYQLGIINIAYEFDIESDDLK